MKQIRKGVFEDYSFLIKFMRNLLLGENNVLKNRELHISTVQIASATTTKENRVIELMKKNSKIKIEEIAVELGVSSRTIKSIIALLEKKGLVKRVGGKKLGYWEIN